MTRQELAAEAQRLKDNEAFQLALDHMRSAALEGFVRTSATDAEAIRDHQAKVWVVDELRGDIEAFIRNGQPKKPAGIV